MLNYGMNDDIKNAIAKNLPAEMSGILKEQLERIPVLEKQLDDALEVGQQNFSDYKKQLDLTAELLKKKDGLNKDIETWEARESDLLEREKAVTSLETEGALLRLETEMHKTRVEDCKEIAGMVFGNNKFKYNETVNKPGLKRTIENVYDPNLGIHVDKEVRIEEVTVSETKEVEGEQ